MSSAGGYGIQEYQSKQELNKEQHQLPQAKLKKSQRKANVSNRNNHNTIGSNYRSFSPILSSTSKSVKNLM